MIRKAAFILAVILCASCARVHTQEAPDANRAESLMETAQISQDSNRILALADSLETAGDFGRIEADFWRGYGFYVEGDLIPCKKYWYEATLLDLQSDEDLTYFGRAASRLCYVLLNSGDHDATMRVAVPALQKMSDADRTLCRDYGYLLVSVGCCELNQGDFDEAQANFDNAFDLYTLLFDNNGIDGGSSRAENLLSAMAGFSMIARHCQEKDRYDDALVWVGRMESVLEDYKRQPEAISGTVDRYEALVHFYRASALEGLGEHKEAAAVFDAAFNSSYASSPRGRLEATKYLILAKRWDEAADNFKELDRVASSLGWGKTLDNIEIYLLPKYRANINAHRDREARETAAQICESLDSAIIWNRADKAAELAMMYQTQEIKHQIDEQQTVLDRQGFIASLIVILVMLAGFLLFTQLRRRSSDRLEEANQRLEIASAQAEEASRVKTAFLQQISHEIRTPLNMLSGFSQVLVTPGVELDDESREQIKKGILESTGRISGLVSKVLDLSDLISTPILEKTEEIQLWDLANASAKSCGISDNEDIHFDIQIHPKAKSQMIRTNRKAVTRILGLLLENAAKFTGEGSVTLRIVPKGQTVYFMVEDTGIGVPAKEAEHIFENFVQLDDYREGTGIGLSLARKLARRLGGDVILDTSYTFGARFIFSLPTED